MSFEHINYVRDHSKTRGCARLLLLTIATRTDPKGIAYPSYNCLARDTGGMSKRSIRRTLETIPPDELKIIPGGSIKGGKRRPTSYRIIIPEQDANDIPDRAPGAHSPALESAHGSNGDRAPGAHSTVRMVSPDCAPDAHLTVIEHSINRKEEEERASAQAAEGGSLSFSLASLEEEDRSPSAKTPEEEPAFSRYLKNEQTTEEGENGLTPEKEKNFFPQSPKRRAPFSLRG